MKKVEPEFIEVASGEWMMTFSDLLTLLLAFFVLLLTMSSMDQRKFEEAFGMFSGAFGTLAKQAEPGMTPDFIVPINAPLPEILASDVEDVLERTMREELPEELRLAEIPPEPAEYRHLFEAEAVTNGVEVRIAGALLFDGDSAKLLPHSTRLLQTVAGDIAREGTPVRIKAYEPPRNSRVDAWTLSLDRAASVVDALADSRELDTRLLSIMGYGRPAPRASRLDRTKSVVVIHFFNRRAPSAPLQLETEDSDG